eukprot:jgi/Botrbrau1/447/Bobra.110_2s0094.2
MGPVGSGSQAFLSSLKTVGTSLVTGVTSLGLRENIPGEQIEFAKFAILEDLSVGSGGSRVRSVHHVLLLGYVTGFQVWRIEDGDAPSEILSRREEAVRYLDTIPPATRVDSPTDPFYKARPCLAIIPCEASTGQTPDSLDGMVQFYSFKSHTFIHTLRFQTRVLSLRTSNRIIVVAVDAQILVHDAVSLECIWSHVTYPAPCTMQLLHGEVLHAGTAVPLALGPRWLAFASNIAHTSAGCAVPQRINGALNGETKLSSSLEAMSRMAKAAAKHSGKQLLHLGEAGRRYITSQYEQWMQNGHESCSADHCDTQSSSGDIMGTVQVWDVVTRVLVAHFRAHDSPLLMLEFDPSGTLLVTASTVGHNINIFHIRPVPGQHGSSTHPSGKAIHLYKLCRGLTSATIQDISFSNTGDVVCVSSGRGTTHIFKLSQHGESAKPAHLRAVGLQGEGHCKASKMNSIGKVHAPSVLNGVVVPGSLVSAASKLYTGATGSHSVSTMFIPRRDSSSEDNEHPGEWQPISEDLYVAYDEGCIVKNTLRFITASRQNDDGSTSPRRTSTPDSPRSSLEEGALELRIEHQKAWDVARKRHWPEKEEFLEECSSHVHAPISSAEERSIWMAEAETQLHVQSRQALWNDGQFHVLEMQSTSPSPVSTPRYRDKHSRHEVENIPTKPVNLCKLERSPVEGVAPVGRWPHLKQRSLFGSGDQTPNSHDFGCSCNPHEDVTNNRQLLNGMLQAPWK